MNDSSLPTRRRAPAPAWKAAAAALLSGLVALAPAPAAGQRVAPDHVLRDFEPIGDYVLMINGKQVPAEIYLSQRAAAILVMSSAFLSPVLLTPGLGVAQTVNLMKVQKKPDGSVDLLSDAVLSTQGALDVQDEGVHFKADGISATLATTPPLLGLRRAEEVTAHNPEYLPRAASYTPNPQAVAALKKEPRPVTVRIFYGSWCPHCREIVPHVIKLEQQLRGAKIHFEYFGLPPNFGKEQPAIQNNIKAVPTGIVSLGGKEIGRIADNAWTSPETALAAILGGKGT
jgi:thiol-disulfide isomerase/thioredoxin